MVRKREEDNIIKVQAVLSVAENKAGRAQEAFMKDLYKEIKTHV